MGSPEAERPDSDRAGPLQFEIDPRRFVWRLAMIWVGLECGLIVLDYHINFGGKHIVGAIRRMANMAREDSVANLATVIQLLLLALTLWAIYLTVRKAGGSKRQRRSWLVVASLFSYMAIDDGARMHERIGSAAKAMMTAWADARGTEFADFFPSYAWQIVYLPMFGALGLFMLVFFWFELKPKYSRLMVVAGVSCFVVAVGMDFFEGLDEDHRYNPYRWLADTFDVSEFTRQRFHAEAFDAYRHFSRVFEEAIEMFGITLIWMAVLRHWLSVYDGLRIRFSRA